MIQTLQKTFTKVSGCFNKHSTEIGIFQTCFETVSRHYFLSQTSLDKDQRHGFPAEVYCRVPCDYGYVWIWAWGQRFSQVTHKHRSLAALKLSRQHNIWYVVLEMQEAEKVIKDAESIVSGHERRLVLNWFPQTSDAESSVVLTQALLPRKGRLTEKQHQRQRQRQSRRAKIQKTRTWKMPVLCSVRSLRCRNMLMLRQRTMMTKSTKIGMRTTKNKKKTNRYDIAA